MEAAPHPWPALGVLLMRDGLVSKEDLESILDDQRDTRQQRISGRRLGEILIDRGKVTETQVAKLVAEQYELPFIDLDVAHIDLHVAHRLSKELSLHFSAVPFSTRPDDSCVLAIADPATVLFSDELRRVLGSPLHFAVVGPDAIEAAIAFVHDRHDEPAEVGALPYSNDSHGVVLELRPEEPPTSPTAGDDTTPGDSAAATHQAPPLGALLTRAGLLSEEELEGALAQQRLSTSWRLGEILVKRGLVTPSAVARVIAEQYELPFVELADVDIDRAVAARLPKDVAREYPAIPIAAHEDGSLEVAISDPTNVFYSDELRQALGVPLTFVVAAPDAIDAAIDSVHASGATLAVGPVEDGDEVEPSDELFVPAYESPTPEGVGDVTAEDDVLPDFIDEVVVDEQVAEWLPTWTSELQLADNGVDTAELVVERDEHDTVASELAAVPLAEAASSEDAPETHEPDALVDEFAAVQLPEEADSVHASETLEADALVDEFAAVQLPEAAGSEGAPETYEPDAVANDLEAVLLAEAASSEEAPERDEPDAVVDEFVAVHLPEEAGSEEASETFVSEETPTRPPIVTFVLHEVDEEAVEAVEIPAEPVDMADASDVTSDEETAAHADDLDTALEHALSLGASAIHFSPQTHGYTVRARVDGLVRDLGTIARDGVEPLVEKLAAATSARTHVVSTKQGDKITVFPREHGSMPTVLVELGLAAEAEADIADALSSPPGAIVVCGPVGSGTTTTLYALLDTLGTADRVAATIEDPVDHLLHGVDQLEVDEQNGITFASGLRTLLDTDSDIVVVDQVRDRDTAQIAFHAALAGRHVLSALRAPSAAAAVQRLTDLGVDPSVLSGSLICVVGQRLVRRVCSECRETYYASESELTELGQPLEGSGPRLLARGKGCEACDGTGFRGRVGIFEVLRVTDEIRAVTNASAKAIHRVAVAAGMRTLREEGVRLCLEGVTTAAEVRRVLGSERSES